MKNLKELLNYRLVTYLVTETEGYPMQYEKIMLIPVEDDPKEWEKLITGIDAPSMYFSEVTITEPVESVDSYEVLSDYLEPHVLSRNPEEVHFKTDSLEFVTKHGERTESEFGVLVTMTNKETGQTAEIPCDTLSDLYYVTKLLAKNN